MTLEKAIRLLREARNSVDTLISKYEEDGQDAQRINHQIYILNEIDAALAEPLDFTTPVVEWTSLKSGTLFIASHENVDLEVSLRAERWQWLATHYGNGSTIAEAKDAALKAARKMQ